MRLGVVCYNIHKGIGGIDRLYRPARIADVIAQHEPDLVLLQEVDEGAARSNRDRQVDWLGERLGFRHRLYFPNVRLRRGGHYGNALLSRFPISHAQNIDLTILPTKRRSVLHARLRIRGRTRRARTLHVYNLHLGLSQILRKLQLRLFLNSRPFRHLHPRAPILVGGDFNDFWGTLGPAILAPAGFRGPEAPIRTFPAVAPFRALDSVYVRGDLALTSLDRSAVRGARWASDHRPLVAQIDLR